MAVQVQAKVQLYCDRLFLREIDRLSGQQIDSATRLVDAALADASG